MEGGWGPHDVGAPHFHRDSNPGRVKFQAVVGGQLYTARPATNIECQIDDTNVNNNINKNQGA